MTELLIFAAISIALYTFVAAFVCMNGDEETQPHLWCPLCVLCSVSLRRWLR